MAELNSREVPLLVVVVVVVVVAVADLRKRVVKLRLRASGGSVVVRRLKVDKTGKGWLLFRRKMRRKEWLRRERRKKRGD